MKLRRRKPLGAGATVGYHLGGVARDIRPAPELQAKIAELV